MSLQPGDRVGDWIVEKALGAGGMGSVYLAHSALSSNVRAALKVMGGSGRPDDKDRFVRELDTLAKLDHPNIVRMLGGGTDAERGLLYLTMALVDGEDLSHRLARGPLSPAEAYNVFRQAADALRHSHARGIAHRDIKPSNIMIDESGRAVIVDFGIARVVDGTRLTATGMLPGTMAYVDPVAFSGGIPDPYHADIYALGLVLWESLTGRMAFPDDTESTGAALARMLAMKVASEPMDPGPAFPEPLRRLCVESTQPDPADRLATAQLFLAALNHSFSGPSDLDEPKGKRPKKTTNATFRSVPLDHGPQSDSRGGLTWVFLLVGMMVAGLVGVAFASAAGVLAISYGGVTLFDKAPPPPKGPFTTDSGAPSVAPTPSAPTPPSGNAWLGNAIILAEFGELGSGIGQFDDPRYVAADADGGIYVAEYSEGRVYKFGPDGAFEWQVTVAADRHDMRTIQGMAVAPHGPLYVSRRGDILVLSPENGEQINVFVGKFAKTWYTGLAVDGEGQIWAMHASAGQDDMLVLDKTGAKLHRHTEFVSGINDDDPSISLDHWVTGDGHVYVSSSFGELIYVYDRAGKYIDRFGDGETSYGAIAVVNDKVFVSEFAQIGIYDNKGAELGAIPTTSMGAIRDVAVDVAGNLYAVTSNGRVLKLKPN